MAIEHRFNQEFNLRGVLTMWCGFGKSSLSIATTCVVTATIVISDTSNAQQNRVYTPQQFRAVLRGLSYKVKVSNQPLTDAETKKAITEFQTGYKLKPADGIAGLKTQNFAANIVKILQANLNVVMKPNPPLPRDQFYGTRTEAVVKEFQKKYQLPETGIADLALRQKLNEEAKNILGNNPASTITTPAKPSRRKPTKVTPTPTPAVTETPTPEVTETPTPAVTETPTPAVTETPTPEVTETPTPKPTVTPRKPAQKK
jgi:peptidoglycan hydrolase-like protein with peptidoglycan-binding domain